MFASPTAMWLDSFFAGYDHFFLKLLHGIADTLGVVVTPLMRLISLLGEKGLVFFLLALIFLLCADRRDLGLCIFGAVCCGALITNIILKDSVARIRPYEATAEYNLWWATVGSPLEDGFSFPSGHVTACAAGMTAISLMRGRKWIVPSAAIVLAMGISRNYLLAHYPSDVLAAVFIGVFSGFVAWFITQFIFRTLRRRRRAVPVFGVILEFDVRDYLPFELPSLPFGKGMRANGSGGRAAAGKPTREDEGFLDEDEDVKTYTGGGRHAAPAGNAAARAAAPAREPEAGRPAPARRGGSAGGRHAKAEPAREKKAARFSLPGSYKGKHER